MTEHYDCNSNLWNCTLLRMSAGAHFSQHGMATYSTMTRPNMTRAMPHTHTPQYMLCKMGQRTLQTTHKKKRGMGHYIPHKQGMRRYTTQKGTMGIFYATHETNNRTLNTQQNKESLCTTNLILMKFTVTPRRFREVHHVPSCSLFRGCQFIVHTRPQSS